MVIGIVGLTGSGKSTIATMVAEITNMTLFDMDNEFPNEYRQRHLNGEVVPAKDVKGYQRPMIKRLLKLEATGHVILAGFFLDKELPSYIESRVDVLWINLVTDKYSVLKERIMGRKDHFSVGIEVLDDNWPSRQEQIIGNILIDCVRPTENIVRDCLFHIENFGKLR
ncbi:MAG: shikimate kinase [Candidatus Uhrbacteria bacterium]